MESTTTLVEPVKTKIWCDFSSSDMKSEEIEKRCQDKSILKSQNKTAKCVLDKLTTHMAPLDNFNKWMIVE